MSRHLRVLRKGGLVTEEREENDARVPLDYAPNDVAVLAAVHDRFRALFMQTYRLVERGDVMVPERRTTDE